MSRIISLHPPRAMLDKWGILSYVDEAECNRILGLPHGQTKPEIRRLGREVDLLKYPRKKKSIVTTSWYNANKIQRPIEIEKDDDEKDIDS
jgi:hypothetical protein